MGLKLLALETTDRQGTIAAMQDGTTLLEMALIPEESRSAQTLAPSIKSLMAQLGWTFAELDAIAVAVGPGSFTGLRVGVTTAKTLAYALSIPILGVSSLEALARKVGTLVNNRIVSTAIDAQRGDVAVALFYIDETGDTLPLQAGFRVIPITDWLNVRKNCDESKTCDCENNTQRGNLFYSGVIYQKIQAALSKDYVFCGPVLKRLENRVSSDIQTHFATKDYWYPRAGSVAEVAWGKLQRDEKDDPWSLVPIYSRLSAAEEKAASRTLSERT